MHWRYDPLPRDRIRELGRELGVSEILAELLLRVPIETAEQARQFLDPRLAEVGDPFALLGLDAAVDRLNLAIARGERVTVFGDYDVDGVTATVVRERQTLDDLLKGEHIA